MKKKVVNKNTKVYKKKLARKEDKKLLKNWANKVKMLDGNKCAICGRTDRLNAHHILPREYKPTRYWTLNGIALCPKHHQFSREISPHANSFVFFMWLLDNRPNQVLALKKRIESVGKTHHKNR